MAESQSQIAFDQAGLGSVLKQNILIVPMNQREYAWTDREVRQLFHDFAKAISDDEANYFLGTIVTIPRKDNSLEVVDGQQRLATTAILLAAIRDYLSEEEKILVESINNEFLTGIDRDKRSRVPKLKLNVDDNLLFRWIIAKAEGEQKPKNTKPSHERLESAHKEAIKHVSKTVAPHDDKNHGDILNKWVSFIEKRAMVVLLKVPNDANAYKMFETLNDRGLRTSQADLIKNYLFGKAGNRISEVQSNWNYMRGTLESLEDENITVEFLRHALTILRGLTRHAQVYDAVQNRIKGEESAVTFIAELESMAFSYVAILNSSHEKWNGYPNSIRHAIDVLSLLNIGPMRALLLAISLKFAAKNAAESFKFLVSVGVRLLITGSTRTGSVESTLARTAHEVFEDNIGTKGQLKAALSNITPNNQEFLKAFESAKVSKAQLARYYLRCLESVSEGKSQSWFVPNSDEEVINLEHVLPKKPGNGWPQFSGEEVTMFVNRIGNQTLMEAKENSTLGSAPFSDKRMVYKSSPYELTKSVGEKTQWTTGEITQRQQQLSKLALKAWKI